MDDRCLSPLEGGVDGAPSTIAPRCGSPFGCKTCDHPWMARTAVGTADWNSDQLRALLRRRWSLAVDHPTARTLTDRLATGERRGAVSVRGRDLVTGLAREIATSVEELRALLGEPS